MMTTATIGLIGAGRMGLAQIKHLIRGGYQVAVCERDETNQTKAMALGAYLVDTPEACFDAAEIVYVAVGFDPEVEAVCRGPHGLMSSARRGGVVVVNSTCDPEFMQEMADAFATKGHGFLDVPIARGGWAADNGTLLAMVGGDQAALERVRPSLSTFCSDIEWMGGVGTGQVTKAINNLLLWLNGIGLLESAQIAEAYGLNLAHLRKVLLVSSGKSAAMEDWSKMTFSWAAKDMQIVSAMMSRHDLTLPLLDQLSERSQVAKAECEARRRAGRDWAAE
jgi:3-hydroxyisobutyrate dehydrogenase